MDISFDPAKNARNIALRGISFERAAEFEWNHAHVIEDLRRDYGEPRYRALGLIARVDCTCSCFHDATFVFT